MAGREEVEREVLHQPIMLADTNQAYLNDAGEYACGQERASLVWLNRADVQAALHVKLVNKASFTFSTGLNYTFVIHSLADDIKTRVLGKIPKVLVYSGMADPCVPTPATALWINDLGLEEMKAWRPWLADGPHASGAVSGYRVDYATGLTFATVRGAGHMVPRYKPTQTFSFVRDWLAEAEES